MVRASTGHYDESFVCTGPKKHTEHVQAKIGVSVALLDHTGRVFLSGIPELERHGTPIFTFPWTFIRYGELPEESVHRILWEHVGIPIGVSPLIPLGSFLKTTHNVALVHGFLAQPARSIYSLPRIIPEGATGIAVSFRGIDGDALVTDGDRQLLRLAKRFLDIR